MNKEIIVILGKLLSVFRYTLEIREFKQITGLKGDGTLISRSQQISNEVAINNLNAIIFQIQQALAELQSEPTEADIERVASKLSHLEGEYINDYNHIKEIARAAIKAMRDL